MKLVSGTLQTSKSGSRSWSSPRAGLWLAAALGLGGCELTATTEEAQEQDPAAEAPADGNTSSEEGPGAGGPDAAPGSEAATAPREARSTTIALTSDDRYLVTVNRQNDSVSILEVRDAAGNDHYAHLAELKVGKEPRYVAISPDNRSAYVSNTVDGTISVIALAGAESYVAGEPIRVGTEPRGIVVTPNGKYVYVANHTQGSVSIIRTSDRSVVGEVHVGGNPQAIAMTNDGDGDDSDEHVMVARFFGEVIDEARPDGFDDAKEGVIARFSVADSLAGAASPAWLYIRPLDDSGFKADRRSFCRNTRRLLEEQGQTVFFNSGADGVPDAPEQGAGALANEAFCPDTASHDESPTGPIGAAVQGAYPNQLYAALVRGGYLLVPNVGAAPEPPVKFNVNVQALVSVLRLEDGADKTTNLNDQIKKEPAPSAAEAPHTLARLFGNDVVAIDADATGEELLIVSRGGNYVMRAHLSEDGSIDIGAPSGVVRFQTGNLPSGVVMSLDGKRAYTNNELSTSVTAIDLVYDVVLERDLSSSEPPAAGTQKHRNLVGKLAFFTALGIPDTLDTYGWDGVFDIELRDIEPLSFRGKASDNAWSACSSCHEDGHSDNVTWIFPTGPRQTIPLEGTFAPGNASDQRILNWNAVRGSVTDFNNNSRGVQGGIGFATDVHGEDRTALIFNHGPTRGVSDALDAMTEWVANAVRAPIMPQPEAALYAAGYGETESGYGHGADIFEEACASCHGGAKWTKSSIEGYLHDPTFDVDPLGAQFFAGVAPRDPKLSVLGPQINALLNDDGSVALQFLERVGTFDAASPLEIRGAGAIAGQSTQGFASLGGAGFNVPSLLGVGYHAPYLHDGSALSLADVFETHTLSWGDASRPIAECFDEQALADLELFVKSIDGATPTF